MYTLFPLLLPCILSVCPLRSWHRPAWGVIITILGELVESYYKYQGKHTLLETVSTRSGQKIGT